MMVKKVKRNIDNLLAVSRAIGYTHLVCNTKSQSKSRTKTSSSHDSHSANS